MNIPRFRRRVFRSIVAGARANFEAIGAEARGYSGEDTMNRLLEQGTRRRRGIARGPVLPGAAEECDDLVCAAEPPRAESSADTSIQLPPTRAARPARSRGAFLATARRWMGPARTRRVNLSRITLAAAVVAVASALVVSAPSRVMDSAVAASRGLALIGATSVPPSFIVPAKSH